MAGSLKAASTSSLGVVLRRRSPQIPVTPLSLTPSGLVKWDVIGGDRLRAAVASSRRQGRCGGAEPGQTRWPPRACGELLTRSASPCPARTATMGKGSSRGHHPPLESRSHPGTGGGLPGSPWQRSPARIPAPRPPWGLAAGSGERAVTRASRDKDGFSVSRVASGRLGRGALWCQVSGACPAWVSGASLGARRERGRF